MTATANSIVCILKTGTLRRNGLSLWTNENAYRYRVMQNDLNSNCFLDGQSLDLNIDLLITMIVFRFFAGSHSRKWLGGSSN